MSARCGFCDEYIKSGEIYYCGYKSNQELTLKVDNSVVFHKKCARNIPVLIGHSVTCVKATDYKVKKRHRRHV